MHKPSLVLPLTLILFACATGGGSGTSRSSSRLTAAEIVEVAANTAYEAVQMARPAWLHRRSAPSTGSPQPVSPVVYLDGLRVGDVGELRRIRASVVAEMRFLTPSDATNRYGTNHTGGAILVTTR